MALPGGVLAGQAYADPRFAASLSEFGTPVHLEHSGATVLLSRIADEDHVDAVGPYPLLSCPRPELLGSDLDQLRDHGAVSLTAVLDPLRPPAPGDERFAVLRPFKTHFLTVPPAVGDRPSPHHRRQVRLARSRVTVQVEPGRSADVAAWMDLWGVLVAQHGLTSMRAGSRQAFAAQFALQGSIVMWASVGEERVAAQFVLATDKVAYVHLAAASALGRACRAMYALDAALLELAEDGGLTIHWGGGSGPTAAEDGLTAYKRGWANATREAQLLGAVLEPATYARLSERSMGTPSGWFPAYRDPQRRPAAPRSDPDADA
jgi:hypothetical protein